MPEAPATITSVASPRSIAVNGTSVFVGSRDGIAAYDQTGPRLNTVRHLNEHALQEACVRHGVRVSPGSYYFPSSPATIQLRLSISRLEEDSIVEGLARLGRAMSDFAREV